MRRYYTDRATEKEITNSVNLFREYLRSLPREVFTKYFFLRRRANHDEWSIGPALQDFRAWTLGVTESGIGIKHDMMSHEEGLLFEHYCLFDRGCSNRYDVEMSNAFARVCRSYAPAVSYADAAEAAEADADALARVRSWVDNAVRERVGSKRATGSDPCPRAAV